MAVEDIVAVRDPADDRAGGIAPCMQRRRALPPAEASALELVTDRQVPQLAPDISILDVQSGPAGVHLALMLPLQRPDLGNLAAGLGCELDRLADAVPIVERRATEVRAEAVPSPIHDQVSREPQIMTHITGRCRRRDQDQQ